jgi:tripartite ATP-independent transporter DctP family solute receptor
MIEDLSGGSIKIDWHPYNELGDDLNVISNVQFGEIDIGLTSPAPVTTMLPNMSIFDTLYMINDQETAYEVMDGEIGQQIDKDVEALGMKVIMWCENGFRNLTCNVEVTGLDSLKGLKIRTMENSLQMDAWKALGANPTPMNFGEVYTALQQGTVEGQENPLGLIDTNGFMEVQDYLVLSEHNYTPMPVMINLEKYNSLTDNQRAIMDYVSDYVEQWERERNIEVNQQILDQFKADNVNIIELDDATKDSFRQAIDDAGVYDEIREALANPELMDVLEGLNA